MKLSNFKQYFEATDIFGFDKTRPIEVSKSEVPTEPIHRFDIELMMNFLSQKKLGVQEAYTPFVTEIRWGQQPGALKLEIDTGYSFYIKKLGVDLEGNPRWITKKMFQLNRQGFGGYEDSVAQEVFEQIEKYSEENIESPVANYNELHSLVDHIYKKLIRESKYIFIPEGIKKINDDAFIIKFGVRGQGVESRDQTRVEQNQTLISYDKNAGTLRVTNYNIKSPVGGRHEWKIYPSDLDLYFFPSQDREEISETVLVHMKYY